MRRPINGTLNKDFKITTKFKDPDYGSLGAHLGIDYGVGVGTPVYAPVSGIIAVRKETSGKGSGGKQFELHGDDGRWHRLLHLDSFSVAQGEHVNEGQLLGHSGRTGDVTGPHLHWDVRKANTAWNASLANYVNPESLLPGSNPVGDTEMVSIRLNGGKSQHWNMRTSPDMGKNIRTDGYGIGGQTYSGTIVEGGWAKINFRSAVAYVGPAAFTKI